NKVPPRWQNPHMHLFESALALHDITKQPRWRTLADSLFALSQNVFIDSKSGALREYFSLDWKLASEQELRVVEPGHCFEWSWLAYRHGGDEAIKLANGLARFARSYGVDARGIAFYSVELDGTPRDKSARLWAQTERLKAALAAWRASGDTDEAAEAALA